MSAPKFVGDANREPQLRIGVLMATLRHAKEGISLAIDLLDEPDSAHAILVKVHADIAEKLELMAKADGT